MQMTDCQPSGNNQRALKPHIAYGAMWAIFALPLSISPAVGADADTAATKLVLPALPAGKAFWSSANDDFTVRVR